MSDVERCFSLFEDHPAGQAWDAKPAGSSTCSVCGKAFGVDYCDHCGSRYQFCDGENCNYIVPSAMPQPDAEPSWRDYSAVSLHDLIWLLEMAEEYEWSHRADQHADLAEVDSVIKRLIAAANYRKPEASDE